MDYSALSKRSIDNDRRVKEKKKEREMALSVGR